MNDIHDIQDMNEIKYIKARRPNKGCREPLDEGGIQPTDLTVLYPTYHAMQMVCDLFTDMLMMTNVKYIFFFINTYQYKV